MAIPIPITNSEGSATPKRGNSANTRAPAKANRNADKITVLAEYFSTITPAGTDIIPYATKKAKGKKPANPMPNSKLLIISGIIGPRILVRNDITKKISMISITINAFPDFIATIFKSLLLSYSAVSIGVKE
jgi:hypothetical protein